MMEVSASGKTEVEVVEGVQYDKGLTNSHFITNKQNKTAELDNPLVLLVESTYRNNKTNSNSARVRNKKQ